MPLAGHPLSMVCKDIRETVLQGYRVLYFIETNREQIAISPELAIETTALSQIILTERGKMHSSDLLTPVRLTGFYHHAT